MDEAMEQMGESVRGDLHLSKKPYTARE